MPGGEEVGDFYVHMLHGPSTKISIDKDLTSSTKLLKLESGNKPTVIHFYDGGWGGCRPCAAQMEQWAKTIPDAQFLCVCVESKQVALAFHKMFRFENCMNGYIPSRPYFPVGYGQLGCSGFIVSDKDGCFVSRKTRAFLQYGEHAFREVEAILETLISDEEEETKDDNDNGMAPPTKLEISRGDPANKKQKKEDSKKTVKAPPSVGVDSMDHEHEECTNSFNRLFGDPSLDNLQELYDILKAHFHHEEELIETYMPSKAVSSFSAVDSHKQDHGRILKIAETELEKAALAACAANEGGVWQKSKGCGGSIVPLVDLDVVQEIADAFHLHAERFDVLYESKIPASAQ